MDTLLLENLSIQCIIGDLPHERIAPQTLILDLELTCDIERAAQSDALEDTVNYVAVIEAIRQALVGAQCKMIERAAQLAVDATFATDARIHAVTLTLRKPSAVAGVCPGIRLSRTR